MVWEADKPSAGFSTAKPWLPVPPAHVDLAVDTQERVAGSVLAHYRQALAFRKAHAALIDGDIEFLKSSNQDLLVFTRAKGDDTFLFVFNLTREAAQFVLPSKLKGLEAVAMPGFNAGFDGKAVELSGLDGFCGRM
jgi:alpha-glucosidase